MSIVTLVLLSHTVILVVASLLLLYPVISYAWNVAYTREIQLLAISFVLLAGGYVAGILFRSDLASNAFDLFSAIAAFWAMWRLATRFVQPEASDVSLESMGNDSDGGFRGGD